MSATVSVSVSPILSSNTPSTSSSPNCAPGSLPAPAEQSTLSFRPYAKLTLVGKEAASWTTIEANRAQKSARLMPPQTCCHRGSIFRTTRDSASTSPPLPGVLLRHPSGPMRSPLPSALRSASPASWKARRTAIPNRLDLVSTAVTSGSLVGEAVGVELGTSCVGSSRSSRLSRMSVRARHMEALEGVAAWKLFCLQKEAAGVVVGARAGHASVWRLRVLCWSV
mmetsp:Transcript_27463/g.59159  ORF Transcript_27463/g.59159 Transcript_27463/m.59159 type:complete len:224 (-) Transcript_27463:107-778(-)